MSQDCLFATMPVSSDDLAFRPPQSGGATRGWNRVWTERVRDIPMTAQGVRTG
jgi:hypothetical protein